MTCEGVAYHTSTIISPPPKDIPEHRPLGQGMAVLRLLTLTWMRCSTLQRGLPRTSCWKFNNNLDLLAGKLEQVSTPKPADEACWAPR